MVWRRGRRFLLFLVGFCLAVVASGLYAHYELQVVADTDQAEFSSEGLPE